MGTLTRKKGLMSNSAITALVVVTTWTVVASVTGVANAHHLTREAKDRYERLDPNRYYQLHNVKLNPVGDNEVEACFENKDRSAAAREYRVIWSVIEWSQKRLSAAPRVREERTKPVSSGEWGCSRFDVKQAIEESGFVGHPSWYIVWAWVRGTGRFATETIGNEAVAVKVDKVRSEPPYGNKLEFEDYTRDWEP